MHEFTMARMAQNAQDARRVGDIRTAEYWEERVEVANLREHRESQGVTHISVAQLDELDARMGEIPTPGLLAMVAKARERDPDEWACLKGSPDHG